MRKATVIFVMSVCYVHLPVCLEQPDSHWMDYRYVLYWAFLGALAKLRKATVSYVISDHMEQLGSHPADFHVISFMRICRKSLDNIGFIKIREEKSVLKMKTYLRLC